MTYKTHSCGELTLADKNKNVILSGWIHRVRNKGKIIWLDLRDRYGITQIVVEERNDMHKIAQALNREFVITVKGIVKERENKNTNISTGAIEVVADEIKILNEAETPPFTLEENTDGGPDLLAKFRYLDLRRQCSQEDIILKNDVIKFSRNYLNANEFLDIETPNLVKSTPEGARDFVVPTRDFPNQYYALPQSPQLFKQLLMMSGFGKYYQVAKCFRDEDLRADRQPEFSQLDCEMAFVSQEDILTFFEGLMMEIFGRVKGILLPEFTRLTYDEAMEKYGCDKPDLRYAMAFKEITTIAKNSTLEDFQNSEIVTGFLVEGLNLSRKEIQNLEDDLQKEGRKQKRLFTIKISEEQEASSSISKFFEKDLFEYLVSQFEPKPNDMIMLLAGDKEETLETLGELRVKMAEVQPKITDFAPLWVTDFPLFEWSNQENRLVSKHHPFTMPNEDDFHLLKNNPVNVRSQAYDCVINGAEVGGGSIRIHKRDLQQEILEILGFSKERAKKSFGFFLDALKYGAPPHGGIAFGIDRLCAIMQGKKSIRSFIAFPKNNSGRDVMMDAPGEILE